MVVHKDNHQISAVLLSDLKWDSALLGHLEQSLFEIEAICFGEHFLVLISLKFQSPPQASGNISRFAEQSKQYLLSVNKQLCPYLWRTSRDINVISLDCKLENLLSTLPFIPNLVTKFKWKKRDQDYQFSFFSFFCFYSDASTRSLRLTIYYTHSE